MSFTYLRSPPGAEAIVVEGAFKAPIEKVWRAWTDAEQLMRWFGGTKGDFDAMEVDVRVGGRWRFVMSGHDGASTLEGEYLVVENQSRLVYTWSHVQVKADGAREATPQSQVSITFQATEGGCQVNLRHEGIQSADAQRGIGSGWNGSFERLDVALV
ncbi:MAG: SRPBCC family protein [Alphaproteobacteria bacterium]